MTENEKRIVTLLYREGPLSKPEICHHGGMGWATAVKLINRLKESDVVESRIRQDPGQGKNPEIHGLSNRAPVAVGMDVEFTTTNIILLNLRGETVTSRAYETPQNPTSKQLRSFLGDTLAAFLAEQVLPNSTLAGVGIGLPGIGMFSWVTHNKDYSTDLSADLESELGCKVRIDINVRVYSIFEKWTRPEFDQDDVLFLTIRSGIGSGMFLNGSLYSGHQEHAGEIGHMTVRPGGLPCVCGRTGCLQTEVNQNNLYREYQERVLGLADDPDMTPSHSALAAGLADLFGRAREGDASALPIVENAGRYLGECLASCVMILNVPRIVVFGEFGEDGAVILESIQKEVRSRILPRMEVSIEYRRLNEIGFTVGAALLILRDYYTGIPDPGRMAQKDSDTRSLL